MLLYEAVIVAQTLDRMKPRSILDIGSSSRADREIIQPHIAAAFNGHNVRWSTLNGGPLEETLDITDPQNVIRWREWKYEMVTCFSVLEHVPDIDRAISCLVQLPAKWLFVAVPYSYPEHHFPIDNLWRPTSDELAERLEQHGVFVTDRFMSPPETFQGVENASASLVVARVHEQDS